MSRARQFGGIWFNGKLDHQRATSQQLETLAALEGIEIDDLLDAGLTQGQVKDRLKATEGKVVPSEVLEARRERRAQRQTSVKCRICDAYGWECDGSITRHHFIPRWLMRELSNYATYSARSKCCIPVCVGRHRDLHTRDDDPKSIVEYLTDSERKLAQQMLDDLHEQRPAIFDLLIGGDETRYEYQLVRDYKLGRFRESSALMEREDSEVTAV